MTVTASQLARHTGRSRQEICKLLASVRQSAPDVETSRIGWPVDSLPAILSAELIAVARRRGFHDVAHLFSAADEPWQPPAPISQYPPADVEDAKKLRAVMAPFLRLKDSETRSQAEFEADGVTAWQLTFGRPITGRWFRELFQRTIDRDNGLEDFTRLEIYLSDRVSGQSRRAGRTKYNHAALGDRLAFKNPGEPTLSESNNAFEYSFLHVQALAADHPGRADDIKNSTLNFMDGHGLARSKKTLRRNWNRKHAKWLANGRTPSAIADQRPGNSGNFRMDDLEPDLKLITNEAFHHDGKISIAIRKLRKAGSLSQTFVDRYTLDVRRNKSYVAKSIREEISSRLEGMLAWRRSKWAANMAGPRIARDWTGIRPGDFFAADDVTFNIVWWYVDDDGRAALTRGEVLLFFDCRSLYPLGYVMVPGHYNGETIRRGLLHIHDHHGLPHRGFIFECGVWKSRLLLPNQPRDFLGWDEYEMRLREHGLSMELCNVTTPGAKVIEGIFNILQQDQRNQRGFVGFNEREYEQEKLQKYIARVRRGLADPSKEFHSDVEWRDALDRSLEAYFNEPQNGELLQGQSPAELFATHKPLRKLPDGARFLLASHRVRAKVKSNGLAITIRGKRRFYYNEALGPYVGRNVFVFYNIEQPGLLTISDLDMKNFFSVKHKCVPAFDATNEQLAEINRNRAAFMRPAKERYDQIKHPVRKSIVRDNVLDDDAQALGNHIRQATEQHEKEQAKDKREFAQLLRITEEHGIALPPNVRNPRRVMEAIKDRENEPARAKKDYILKPSSGAKPTTGLYWSLWAKLERIKGKRHVLRHQLTQKHLGSNPLPSQMTPERLGKMIDVFSAIIRDSTAAPV